MSGALLRVRQLQVRFGAFTALQDISFDLNAGETLGLVGESGSGKSTLARAILRLVPTAGGQILWSGENVMAWSGKQLRQRRRDMQLIFQDPVASLNPRMSAADAVAERLEIFEASLSAVERRMRVAEMLERVGLPASMAERHPHEFSGGQCQRIGIARAMILRPRLLVCDEPVSSLDVSIQGQIVNLLVDLQKEWGTAMLFISHNLAVVRHLSHRVLVIYRGRVVETATRDVLFAAPGHPYTRALLAAVPDPRRAFVGAVNAGAVPTVVTPGSAVQGSAVPTVVPPGSAVQRSAMPTVVPPGSAVQGSAVPTVVISGNAVPTDATPGSGVAGGLAPPDDMPTTVDEAAAARAAPQGCAYQGRCRYAQKICGTAVPPLQEIDAGHSVACHRWREVVYS